MGTDIHTYVEVRKNGVWTAHKEFTPFDWRSYGMFGFLAGVRNYSQVPLIQEPTYAVPDDCSSWVREESDWLSGAHSHGCLTLRQLVEYDYTQVFWDRRVMKQIGAGVWNGAALAEEGEGRHLTIRKFLGEDFFVDIEKLKLLGGLDDVRVIFWFDS